MPENDEHLKGLTGKEINFIRSFAKLTAEVIIKDRTKERVIESDVHKKKKKNGVKELFNNPLF